ncbi:hypothetical protein HRI_000421000 [Hibiscus trionum]|uniref:HMG box domain-containing protein n=1 Tax=Hibiscus trionum TaxID=183268 RepID=A0A9W7LK95_HIBTR|nr:hypothetical protein HRI_000421000 [Hibiscus trionum]
MDAPIEGDRVRVNDDIVRDDEAQKPLCAYFNFYISECKGLKGGRKKMTNAARKALGLKWVKMSDVEKKPFFDMQVEQKQAYMKWIAKEILKLKVKKID